VKLQILQITKDIELWQKRQLLFFF